VAGACGYKVDDFVTSDDDDDEEDEEEYTGDDDDEDDGSSDGDGGGERRPRRHRRDEEYQEGEDEEDEEEEEEVVRSRTMQGRGERSDLEELEEDEGSDLGGFIVNDEEEEEDGRAGDSEEAEGEGEDSEEAGHMALLFEQSRAGGSTCLTSCASACLTYLSTTPHDVDADTSMPFRRGFDSVEEEFRLYLELICRFVADDKAWTAKYRQRPK
jgi:hypothetical protein